MKKFSSCLITFSVPALLWGSYTLEEEDPGSPSQSTELVYQGSQEMLSDYIDALGLTRAVSEHAREALHAERDAHNETKALLQEVAQQNQALSWQNILLRQHLAICEKSLNSTIETLRQIRDAWIIEKKKLEDAAKIITNLSQEKHRQNETIKALEERIQELEGGKGSAPSYYS